MGSIPVTLTAFSSLITSVTGVSFFIRSYTEKFTVPQQRLDGGAKYLRADSSERRNTEAIRELRWELCRRLDVA